ncbi:Transmembrane protein [Porphyridium purpureum]|uniref:Transmembrane protein n=1 Tax=Porphyridium purpureum TaxID=35688 RepID=A0A5J4Z0F6_PORPP|nr:Transmembrane protein [Porphyridium purpureum]|eukprot:POR1305..scf209_3
MIPLWLILGTASTVFAWFVSCYEIRQHLAHYSRPDLQMHIVRVLGMVPVYSSTALLSLFFKNNEKVVLILDVIRDSYEAYVIYNFLVLLINYGGGERHLIHALELQPRMEHPFPLTEVLPPMKLGTGFMYFVRSACLQFVFVKPATAVLVLCTAHRGSQLLRSIVRIAAVLINNMSVTVALYGLLCFYHAVENVLRPYKPLPKFLSVKLVIFLTFWQGMVLSLMIKLGILVDVEGFSAMEQASGLQDLLICFEMAGAAVMHLFVFSCQEVLDYPDLLGMSDLFSGYTDEDKRPILRNFGDIVDFRDVLFDAKASIYGSCFEREMHEKGPVEPIL